MEVLADTDYLQRYTGYIKQSVEGITFSQMFLTLNVIQVGLGRSYATVKECQQLSSPT